MHVPPSIFLLLFNYCTQLVSASVSFLTPNPDRSDLNYLLKVYPYRSTDCYVNPGHHPRAARIALTILGFQGCKSLGQRRKSSIIIIVIIICVSLVVLGRSRRVRFRIEPRERSVGWWVYFIHLDVRNRFRVYLAILHTTLCSAGANRVLGIFALRQGCGV